MTVRSILLAAAALAALPAAAQTAAPPTLRIATFNASLNRNAAGDLLADLANPASTANRVQHAKVIAEILQRTNADIVLINEFDFYPDNAAADLFNRNFLQQSQNVFGIGATTPVNYAYSYTAPSNTGIASGFDLNNNGVIVTTPGAPGYGDDALGFGAFPGQFGMAVFSKYAIDYDAIRTFQNFKWQDMPGALLPDDASTAAPNDWYSPEELAVLPLSSKSHWDIPVLVNGQWLHVLTAHPTPPVFDGAEDRNGKRNHDEIRLWADYIADQADYLYDDKGNYGGLDAGTNFVILGDYNADPLDGDSVAFAIDQLLKSPFVDDSFVPSSAGGPEAAALQGGANAAHKGDPRYDTADFADGAPGNLRVDMVLGSKTTTTLGGGVFWPASTDPLYPLTGSFNPANFWAGFPSSDHRLVYKDLALPAVPEPATWAMLITGFGLTGAAMRRRRPAAA